MSEKTLRIIVVGDSTVGKTAAIIKFVDGISASSTIPTVGVDFKTKKMNVRGENVNLQIWDTAGQERFRSLTNSYFRKAQGIALFFDVTNRDSFTHLQSWLDSINDNMGASGFSIPIVVLGNKVDLASQRTVTQDEALKFLSDAYPYFDTSAKTGEGVREAFTQVAEQIVDKMRLQAVTEEKKSDNQDIANANGKKKGCCG